MARFACSSEIGAPYAICAGAPFEKARIAQAAIADAAVLNFMDYLLLVVVVKARATCSASET
jgi:hypothetical protein